MVFSYQNKPLCPVMASETENVVNISLPLRTENCYKLQQELNVRCSVTLLMPFVLISTVTALSLSLSLLVHHEDVACSSNYVWQTKPNVQETVKTSGLKHTFHWLFMKRETFLLHFHPFSVLMYLNQHLSRNCVQCFFLLHKRTLLKTSVCFGSSSFHFSLKKKKKGIYILSSDEEDTCMPSEKKKKKICIT